MGFSGRSVSWGSRNVSVNFRDVLTCHGSPSQLRFSLELFSKLDKLYVRRAWEKYTSVVWFSKIY